LYQAVGGGETYDGWIPRETPLEVEWTCVKDEVDEADEANELEENTESLSESELPDDVECCVKGNSRREGAYSGAGSVTGGAV
jgi:hypothetical protein